MMTRMLPLLLFALATVLGSVQSQASETEACPLCAAGKAGGADGFATFISAHELLSLRDAESDKPVIIIDARSAEKYAEGHIPGAINLPGASLRTGKAKPGQGDSQYIFLDEQGEPDVARYAKLFGEAGITRDATVVVYGNHAGKADGTIAAMLLDWMGQEKTLFLDGVGCDAWKAAGFELTTEPKTLPKAEYEPQAGESFVWNLAKVNENIGKDSAVFYDTRNVKEFDGTNLRNNKRGGHIPGAVLLDYAAFLDDNKQVKPKAEITKLLADSGMSREQVGEKPVVLYCQTATRVSLPYLVLRELGYPNVAVYDASWHEYGNRDDTKITKPE